MADRRTLDPEVAVSLFLTFRRHLGARDAVAATRWVQAQAERLRGTWS